MEVLKRMQMEVTGLELIFRHIILSGLLRIGSSRMKYNLMLRYLNTTGENGNGVNEGCGGSNIEKASDLKIKEIQFLSERSCFLLNWVT